MVVVTNNKSLDFPVRCNKINFQISASQEITSHVSVLYKRNSNINQEWDQDTALAKKCQPHKTTREWFEVNIQPVLLN